MITLVLCISLAFMIVVMILLYARVNSVIKNKSVNEDLLKYISQIISESSKTSIDYVTSHTRDTIDKFTHAIQSMRDLVQESKTSQEKSQDYITKHMQDVIKTQQDVQKEAMRLSNALSNPVSRGKWGEIQLKRIVELSGMMEHCDFDTQVVGERIRPDMVINLPQNRKIIVDAKVPFSHYMEALEKNEEEYIEKHRENVRSHVNILCKKSYWKEFDESPDFVIMFIPSESFLSMAVGSDSSLIEDAASKNVIIATPMILLATLKAICYSWRQNAIHNNMKEIANVSICIRDSLQAMSEQIDLCENRIIKTGEEYQKLRKTIEKKVFANIDKLEKLLKYV